MPGQSALRPWAEAWSSKGNKSPSPLQQAKDTLPEPQEVFLLPLNLEVSS